MMDEARFREWWTQVFPGVRRSIVSIVGSESIDILQDVSLMAIQRFDEFEDFETFKRWCFIRARWLSLDELTRRGRYVDYSEQLVEDGQDEDRDRSLGELYKLIAKLPTQQRKVTRDRLQGFTIEEVAARLGISPSSVRSLWRFAKQNLVRMIKDDS